MASRLLIHTAAWIKVKKMEFHHSNQCKYILFKLGSVAGPVIQANGKLIFEGDLRSGGFTTQYGHCGATW